jgi:hypothetical protein
VERLSGLSAARDARLALTTLAPASQASTIRGIISGGSWRSMSIGITASPVAWASPAASALSLRKLRESLTMRMSPGPAQSRMRATVLSVLPSSTNTISTRSTLPARLRITGSIACMKCGTTDSSLQTGMTSDRVRPGAGAMTGEGFMRRAS